ncbi:MAG: GPP34 family phosphoprotein [Gammaproteobacteria bacterium]|nr:GPP34 family phosphoprotein [Gammaproteobacteria bacterium]
MMRAPELGLQEQYVLLAMDVTFTVDHVAFDTKWVDIGVAATVLFQLWRTGRVSLEEGRVKPRGALSVGQTDLDALIERLVQNDPPFESRGINSWLLRMANAEPHKAVLEGLAHKGILSRRKRKYKLVLPEARNRIIERLQRVIREGDAADEQTAALVGIGDASRVLETGELSGDSSEQAARVEALGKTVVPVVAAVRTAVSEKKLRDSLTYFYYLGGGTLVALLVARCSS